MRSTNTHASRSISSGRNTEYKARFTSVWIVIPAFNEGKNIGAVLEKLVTLKAEIKGKYSCEILVVDDGSRDNTSEVAKQWGAQVLRHAINLGKGSALRTGCDYAYDQGASTILVMDADGQHDPAKIPEMLAALATCDIVFGYRSFWGRMPFILRFGNWFINNSITFLFGAKIRDTQSGFRAFRAKSYPQIRWRATDYFMESEMIANVGKAKLKYAQIPIPTIYADKYKGTTVLDGVKIVFKMIVHRIVSY